jgi:hypothetical protein
VKKSHEHSETRRKQADDLLTGGAENSDLSMNFLARPPSRALRGEHHLKH